MSNSIEEAYRLISKGINIVIFRLRTQGLATTLLWFLVRGITFITGIPSVRYNQITPEIFVGPQYRKMGKRKLERLGITGVVNMRIEFDDAAHDLTLEHYCHLHTVDDQIPTLDQLNQGVEFIRRVITEGGKVYIHCAGGIGRAPTMAAIYFISEGFKLDDAIDLIKKTRPFIKIVPVQMDRLREFERKQSKRDREVAVPLLGE